MSGSSSEDDTEKFKEAIDKDFLTENLFKKDKEVQSKNQKELLFSLRNKSQSKNVINNPFTIKVTPTYQLYVSKHLSKLLEKTIHNVEVTPQKRKKRKKLSSGIKLLSTSKNFLISDTNSENSKKKFPSFYNDSEFEDSDIEKKAKKVAVSPEWVLSQEEVKHWAPNTKGEVETIKYSKNKNLNNLKEKN